MYCATLQNFQTFSLWMQRLFKGRMWLAVFCTFAVPAFDWISSHRKDGSLFKTYIKPLTPHTAYFHSNLHCFKQSDDGRGGWRVESNHHCVFSVGSGTVCHPFTFSRFLAVLPLHYSPIMFRFERFRRSKRFRLSAHTSKHLHFLFSHLYNYHLLILLI